MDELSWLAEHGKSLREVEEEGAVNYPYVVAPRRVVAMLQTLEYLLGKHTNEDELWLNELGDDLLKEITIDNRSNRVVYTAPVLLVIQAVLHSHSAWTADHFHDLHSANQVLTGKGEINSYLKDNIEALRQKVGALIALQHVIRASVYGISSVPEVFVYIDNKLRPGFNKDGTKDSTSFNPLCNSIVLTLGSLWGKDNESLSYAALMAMSLVTDRRKKGTPESSDDSWQQKLSKFKQVFDEMTKEPEQSQGNNVQLVFLTYGRYFLKTDGADAFKQSLETYLKSSGNNANEYRVFWMSLPRVPSSQMLTNIVKASKSREIIQRFDPASMDGDDIYNINRLSNIFETCCICPLRILPDEVIRSISSTIVGIHKPPIDDIWEQTKSMLTARLLNHPENCRMDKNHKIQKVYAPVPMVHFILKTLHDFMPKSEYKADRFVKLVVTKRWLDEKSRKWPDEQKHIFLPIIAPTLIDLDKEILKPVPDGKDPCNGQVYWEAGKSLSPGAVKLIVARAAAAFIINETMAFGSDQVTVKLDPSNDAWWEAIEHVMKENGHKTLEVYHDFYVGLPANRIYNQKNLTLPKNWKYALGVDVGGTEVKWQVFKLNGMQVFGPLISASGSFSTDPASWVTDTKHNTYKDAEEFAARVKEEVERNLKNIISFDLISVAWCGAVRQAGTTQIVAAPSGIMRFFKGFSPQIIENDLVLLHTFGLVSAFEEAFTKVDKTKPIVYLINDGAAHVEGRQITADNDDLNMALVAGTGLACGVRRGKECIPLLAEAGKMVIDVGTKFNALFPSGVANAHFSKKTLLDLYKEEIENFNVSDKAPAQVLLPFIGIILAQMQNDTKDWQEKAEERLQKEIVAQLSAVEDVRHLSEKWSGEFFNLTCQDLDISLEKWRLDSVANEEFDKTLKDSDLQYISQNKSCQKFFLYLAYLAAARVADLVALLCDTYDIRQITLAGGPMSGAIGVLVEKMARSILKNHYYFDLVIEAMQSNKINMEESHTIRWLYLKNDDGAKQHKYIIPGAYGAVLLALEWLKENVTQSDG